MQQIEYVQGKEMWCYYEWAWINKKIKHNVMYITLLLITIRCLLRFFSFFFIFFLQPVDLIGPSLQKHIWNYQFFPKNRSFCFEVPSSSPFLPTLYRCEKEDNISHKGTWDKRQVPRWTCWGTYWELGEHIGNFVGTHWEFKGNIVGTRGKYF